MAWASFLAGAAEGARDVFAVQYRNQLQMDAEERRNRYLEERDKRMEASAIRAEDRAEARAPRLAEIQNKALFSQKQGLMDMGLEETKDKSRAEEQRIAQENARLSSGLALGNQKSLMEWKAANDFLETKTEEHERAMALAGSRKSASGGKFSDAEKRYNKIWDDVKKETSATLKHAQTGIMGQVMRGGKENELMDFVDLQRRVQTRDGTVAAGIYKKQTGRNPWSKESSKKLDELEKAMKATEEGKGVLSWLFSMDNPMETRAREIEKRARDEAPLMANESPLAASSPIGTEANPIPMDLPPPESDGSGSGKNNPYLLTSQRQVDLLPDGMWYTSPSNPAPVKKLPAGQGTEANPVPASAVMTKADFDALPSGTVFMDKTGKPRRKP